MGRALLDAGHESNFAGFASRVHVMGFLRPLKK
jgi:hypothetical protein